MLIFIKLSLDSCVFSSSFLWKGLFLSNFSCYPSGIYCVLEPCYFFRDFGRPRAQSPLPPFSFGGPGLYFSREIKWAEVSQKAGTPVHLFWHQFWMFVEGPGASLAHSQVSIGGQGSIFGAELSELTCPKKWTPPFTYLGICFGEFLKTKGQFWFLTGLFWRPMAQFRKENQANGGIIEK